MKKGLFTILVGILVLFPLAAQAQYWTGNVNLFLGGKMMDEDDWEPVEQHTEFGLLMDFGQTGWIANVAIDFLGSAGSETEFLLDYDVTTTEINLGLRKAWGDVLRPYLGGGLAIISAKAEVSGLGMSISDDDTGLGFWLNGGLMLTLGQAFNLGLDFRYSAAEVTVFEYDAEAGGAHVGLILGFHW